MSQDRHETLHLLVNLASGRGGGASLAELAETRCAEAGKRLVLHAPSSPNGLVRMAEQALIAARNESGVVAAAGGDGTVRTVAQVLYGSEVPLAVMPVGTFNFFARNHHIPEDVEGALQVALSGRPQPVTLGEVNGQVFLINASFGLYARAIQEREGRTSRFGRNRLVVIASTAASILAGHRSLRLELEVDGTARELRTPTVFVGNNALQLRHVALDVARCMKEHRLAVVVMRPVGSWGLLRLTVRGLLRMLEQEESLESFCADTLVVQHRRLGMSVALDGEILRIKPPLRFRSRPQAIRLMMPADSTGAGDE